MNPKDGNFLPVKGSEKSVAVAVAAPPPVQVPPLQFEKGKRGRSVGGAFGFFFDAVAKVQDGNFLPILLIFLGFGYVSSP